MRKACIRPVWECHLHHLFCLSSSWLEGFPCVSNVLLSCPFLIITRLLWQLVFHSSDVISLCLWFSDMDNYINCSAQSCHSSVLKTSVSFLGSLEVSRRWGFEPSAEHTSDQLVPQLHSARTDPGSTAFRVNAGSLVRWTWNMQYFAAELMNTHGLYSLWLHLINNIKTLQDFFSIHRLISVWGEKSAN